MNTIRKTVLSIVILHHDSDKLEKLHAGGFA